MELHLYSPLRLQTMDRENFTFITNSTSNDGPFKARGQLRICVYWFVYLSPWLKKKARISHDTCVDHWAKKAPICLCNRIELKTLHNVLHGIELLAKTSRDCRKLWQFCCSTQTETEFESATGSASQLTREIILPDHNSHLYLSFNESVENSAYHNLFLKESVFYDWQYIIQNFLTQPTVWRFFVITNIFVPAQMPTLGPYKSN